ncbi:MAG: hypothetical protein HOM96_04505 [Rickettsiales bacterium]|jgi:hypothetical protein|nr:hypothetical protein [Rickettsiales bacterium]
MFRILQKLSIIQILLLAATLIGSLAIMFFLINFFFWFIVTGFVISKIYKQIKKWKKPKYHSSTNNANDYLVAEYEHVEK